MLEAIILLSGVLIGWTCRLIHDQPDHDKARLWDERAAQFAVATMPPGKHEDLKTANSSGVHPAMTRKVYGKTVESSTESARTTR